ncbi:MAG: Stk1 family PASTA domain-containing Ser/Thr kinase [Zhaonellaceae bacterium]|jgi:beta-lactam-binding protein with PASTA domain/tRNA A-37 threonylcarbamoyl transferase component Bud32|nr:Stk1 family PASTA domain-containing Ser/Thr kinase [Clostridia bacterium]
MIGKVLAARYEVLEKIGGGGMAVVYKGKDLLLNRIVTVKVLREQFVREADFIKRFQREAQAVAKLSHPNIVSIYDVGHEQDFHYLVMEYVEGQNLKEIIVQKAPVDPLEAIDYLIQILDALEHAHESGVVHRDIKPHNILVTNNGKVKVTDFGIAQAVTSATLTYSGTVVGSVQYISPEQAKGEPTGIYSDIYSAGVVLYELLTGVLPFTGDNAISIALKHIQSDFAPPSEIVEGIPLSLERVVMKAMAKEPTHRFQSASEMKMALEKIRGTMVEDLPTQVLPAIDMDNLREKGDKLKTKRRKPKPFVWILIPLFLLVAAGGFWLGVQKYFETGEVQVPLIEGKSLTEAEKILDEVGLTYQIDRKVHDADHPENYIIKQSPEPGELIKRTRPVLIDISLGPELKSVPGVIGETERSAKIMLTNAGFTADENVEEVYDEQIPAGTVIDQDPKPETKLPVGSKVRLTVSLGPKLKEIPMPNLLGKTLEEAEKILAENKLEIGKVENEISYEYFSGQIMAQSVQPQKKILQGEAVNLTVSKGPGLTPQIATVEIRVEPDGEQHQIQIVVTDITGTHIEYDEWHNSGDFIRTTAEYFGTGVLKVLQDGEVYYQTPVPQE